MAPFKQIIFDWSGTLVDDLGPCVEAANILFVRYGRPAFSFDEFREKFYFPYHDFYREHLPEISIEELENYYNEAFQMLQESIQPLPFARELLDFCRERGIEMHLLSAIHSEHWRVQGSRLGLAEYFASAWVRQMDKRESIHRMLEAHKLNPQDTLFVGDTIHDIEAGHAGGVTTCGVLTGYDTRAKLESARPHLLFEGLESLIDYLRQSEASRVTVEADA